MLDVLELARNTHLTKTFDGTPVPQEKVDALLEVIRSAPTSLNTQPAIYFVANTPAGRERIAKASRNEYEANLPKILKASHVILFCTRRNLNAEYVDELAAKQRADKKFLTDESERNWRGLMKFGTDLHVGERNDFPFWLEKQVYLTMGIALMGAAILGLDVCPMEGFRPDWMNKEFDLEAKGYHATLLLAIGNRAPDDYALGTPKSRLAPERIFTHLA